MDHKRRNITQRTPGKEQDLLKDVIDNLPQMIFVRDPANRYLMVNDAMAAFLGLPADQVTGRKDADIAHDQQQAAQSHQHDLEVIARGQPLEQDDLVVQGDHGQQRIFHILRVPFPLAGKPRGAVLGIMTEVTAQKQKERELTAARDQAFKASREKALMLSVLSHEIRTPLNSILGMVRLLQSAPSPEEIAENLEVLNFSAHNLLALVDDILSFSRMEEKKAVFEKIPFNLRHHLEHIVRSMVPRAKEQHLQLLTHISQNIPRWVAGDPLRLSQILNNLLGNALKFTPSGTITLAASRDNVSGATLWITFSVKDTGIGIDPDQLAAIFQPFTQGSQQTSRRYGGSGLGLFVTRQLVEAQGGTIRVISEPGKGSEFIFNLPFQKSASPHQTAPEPSDQALPAKARVLMVEDSAMSIVLAKKVFSRWNMDLDIAETGHLATEKVCRKTYDIILLDLQMPELDGFQIMKHLKDPERSKNSDTPVVAFTASAEPEVHEQVHQAGMVDVIVKPYQPEELLNVIRRYSKKEQVVAGDEISSSRLELCLRHHQEELPDIVQKLEWLAGLLQQPGQVPDAHHNTTIHQQIIPLYRSLGLEREAENIQEYLRLVNAFNGQNREFLFNALRGEVLKPLGQVLDLARRIQAETEA